MKNLILIMSILVSFTVTGQDNAVFSSWTNGYEIYSAHKYNDSLFYFSGYNCSEGGLQFTLKILSNNEFMIIGKWPERNIGWAHPYPSDIGEVGGLVKLKTVEKQRVLIIYNTTYEIEEVLVEDSSSLEDLIIRNKINYELAGKYKDKYEKQYIFYPNESRACGFSNKESYQFGSVFGYCFNDEIIFCDSLAFIYKRTKKGLIIYKAQKNKYDNWRKSERTIKLTKTEWINHKKNHNFKGKYTFVSTEVMINGILRKFDKNELRTMRNEIFARHGYKFRTAEMKAYFESQDWYSGLYDDVNDKLTDLEKLNIQLIKRIENE